MKPKQKKKKKWQKIFHFIANVNLIVQHITQIRNGIIKHVNMNVKIIVDAKTIIVGILANVFGRITNIKQKYCWYFSDRVWWNYNCYGYCINKNDKYCSNKCCKYCFNKLWYLKSKRLLYLAYTYISDHINIDNYCLFLLKYKAKRY